MEWAIGLVGAGCGRYIPLVLLAVIAATGVLLVRYLGGWTDNAGWREGRPTALELLEERYARGEINRDEFLEKKRDIVR